MITRERRAKRPDTAIYRQIRRRRVAGNILLEAGAGNRRRRAVAAGFGGLGNVLQLAVRSLRFLLKFRRPPG
jgi:hypothetical protein